MTKPSRDSATASEMAPTMSASIAASVTRSAGSERAIGTMTAATSGAVAESGPMTIALEGPNTV